MASDDSEQRYAHTTTIETGCGPGFSGVLRDRNSGFFVEFCVNTFCVSYYLNELVVVSVGISDLNCIFDANYLETIEKRICFCWGCARFVLKFARRSFFLRSGWGIFNRF